MIGVGHPIMMPARPTRLAIKVVNGGGPWHGSLVGSVEVYRAAPSSPTTLVENS